MDGRNREAALGSNTPQGTRYFGVDLHKDQITWHCITRQADGSLERTNGKVSTSHIVDSFVPMLGATDCYVIVEASCSTFFFYGLIERHCTKAIVINPAAFREMYMTGKKTDRIDAKKLADRLMYHIEMNDPEDGFPEVFVPDAEALHIRKLVTAYELLVKQMTQLKNQFKAVLRSKLIADYDAALEEGLGKLMEDSRLDEADLILVKALATAHTGLGEEKNLIKKAILEMGARRFRNETRLLITVSGISILGAIVFMSDIVTIHRFKSAKKLTAYLASVGKVDSSGNSVREGGLSRRGRRTSYRFILQGLEHIVQGNSGFRRFTERHASKKANKVRSAIVRKTFVAMYYMLKNEEAYRFIDERIYRRKEREFEKLLQNAA